MAFNWDAPLKRGTFEKIPPPIRETTIKLHRSTYEGFPHFLLILTFHILTFLFILY